MIPLTVSRARLFLLGSSSDALQNGVARHGRALPEEIAIGHDLPCGVVELEGRERLHRASVSGG